MIQGKQENSTVESDIDDLSVPVNFLAARKPIFSSEPFGEIRHERFDKPLPPPVYFWVTRKILRHDSSPIIDREPYINPRKVPSEFGKNREGGKETIGEKRNLFREKGKIRSTYR